MVHHEEDREGELSPEQLEAGRLLFAGSCEFIAAANNMHVLPPEGLPEICFAGRSNVGKSSPPRQPSPPRNEALQPSSDRRPSSAGLAEETARFGNTSVFNSPPRNAEDFVPAQNVGATLAQYAEPLNVSGANVIVETHVVDFSENIAAVSDGAHVVVLDHRLQVFVGPIVLSVQSGILPRLVSVMGVYEEMEGAWTATRVNP